MSREKNPEYDEDVVFNVLHLQAVKRSNKTVKRFNREMDDMQKIYEALLKNKRRRMEK